MTKKKKGGGGAGGPQDGKAQGTPGRKTRNDRHNGDATRGKKKLKTTTNRATPARRGPNKPKAHRGRPQEKVRRTKTRPGGRPARLEQEEQAHTHTRGTRAWRPPTRKGRCRRPDEKASVHRPSPPSKDGRYGKPGASVTGSTHANSLSARRPRSRPEVPARDGPIAGPRTGTTRSHPSALASAGASGRHREPGCRPASTCPAQPPGKAGGDSPQSEGRHHGDGKANRSTESDQTGRGAAHQRGATRHAREARRRPLPRHEDRCQATTATRCHKPGKRAQHTTNRGTGEGANDSQAPMPAHCSHGQWEACPGCTPERTRGRGWRSAGPWTPHTRARGVPPRRPRAAPTARKASSQERALWGW